MQRPVVGGGDFWGGQGVASYGKLVCLNINIIFNSFGARKLIYIPLQLILIFKA